MTTGKHRTMTPEQQARSDARRAAFKAMVEKIAALTDADRSALAARMAGVRTVDGHALSVGNALLVGCQRQDVTIVGGFRQWLKQGRVVKKGETGLMLWAPRSQPTETQTVTKEAPASESKEERQRFIAVTVFDVSQTVVFGEPTERTVA